MKKPATHVKILGVKISLDTLYLATSTAPYSDAEARFSKWWRDDLKDSFKTPTVFEKLASRKDGRIPCKAGINRQFFTYRPGRGIQQSDRSEYSKMRRATEEQRNQAC